YGGQPQPVGTAVAIVRMARAANGTVQALLQGVARVRLISIEQQSPFPRARVERIPDIIEPSTELEALGRTAVSLFQRIAALNQGIPAELVAAVATIQNPSNVADFIAANTNLRPEQRQTILAEANVTARLRVLTDYLGREVSVLEVGSQIQSQVKGDLDKKQRDFILREQLRAIQHELGESDQPELTSLREKLAAAHLPQAARREADRELERLATIPTASPEYQVARTYLEWLSDLPWDKSTDAAIDIRRAGDILNADHYALDTVKDRILDYLAVRKLRPEAHGPILCFAGPPGVGKTSLGQAIARAIGRDFVRLSLGGVRDEAEIRGHRRTYVGALPGRILQELRRAGSNNPLMMLDEVDKLGTDFRGDPASALLEVLDPAQNSTFVDHYLDVPFDLSKIMFITTANVLDTVPAPLLDRMEVISIPGYTEREKLEIAMRHLLPRQIQENGLTNEMIEIGPEVIARVVTDYTREAGVRNLERTIGRICRSVARRVAEGQTDQVLVTPELLGKFLGRPMIHEEGLRERDEVGVVTGLAATPAGGDVLYVEAAAMPGKGQLILTGKLGDVMRESAQAALTYTRSRAPEFDIPERFFEEHDLHIHVPAGAVPKDGPSAGVTMATALVSAVTLQPVRKDIAMTGEITLRGNVLPVGAIKEKTLAAHRSGIRTVIIPKDNERDLEDLPKDIRQDLNVILAQYVDDVLNAALLPERRIPQSRLRIAAA
ncbi:MAG: endopeptidase La, partial [Dehalococcoidia bacterium]